MGQVIRWADAGALLWNEVLVAPASRRRFCAEVTIYENRRRDGGATNTTPSVRVWERLEFGLSPARDVVDVARIVTSCRCAGVVPSACVMRTAEKQPKPWQGIRVAMDIPGINFTGASVPPFAFSRWKQVRPCVRRCRHRWATII